MGTKGKTWKVENRKSIKHDCVGVENGCTNGRHTPPHRYDRGHMPWNKGKSTDYMADKWEDPEWAEKQREALGGKPGQKKRGRKVGLHFPTGKPAWNRKEHIIRECLADGCINVVDTPPSLARVRYCSTSCQAKTTNKFKLRVDWPHTGDPYGNDWIPLRNSILERDGNKCVLACDKPGKRLEVHHLCYDATCRDESHVVTLCSKCHQGGHRRELWPIELARKEQR
ncbi:hypothetical protein LCGC14_0264080 [marine sediment metagenome]|uniref:HNH nuclease domain-containing protein n=1 Tax=marine sediment metagenome TaxID=412755 RepID=A0A0F9U5I1_9ZZZZ